ncbi:MAG TPA: Flp family type IVb pilin [Actinomycetales bacterium]|nr:Flp family type IVb pilin [Actinomycetales bacterium]
MTRTRRSGEPHAAPPTDESGATAVEYALVTVLVAAAIASAVAVFGQAVLALFQSVPNPLP